MFPTVYGERERRAYRRVRFWDVVRDNWGWVFCAAALFASLFIGGIVKP